VWGKEQEKINLQKKRERIKMSQSSPSGPLKSPSEEQIHFDGVLKLLDVPEPAANASCLAPGALERGTSGGDRTSKHRSIFICKKRNFFECVDRGGTSTWSRHPVRL